MRIIFLICALSLPSGFHTRPAIVSYHAAKHEVEDIKEGIRKNYPGAEIFITPKGQSDKMREYGWEQIPWLWDNKEIWIQRKPHSDKRMLEAA